jgi:hypothetical protein
MISPLLILNVQDFTYCGNDFWGIALTGQYLVHIAVVNVQASFLSNGFFQPLLLFALSQQFGLYAQTKVSKIRTIHKIVPPYVHFD